MIRDLVKPHLLRMLSQDQSEMHGRRMVAVANFVLWKRKPWVAYACPGCARLEHYSPIVRNPRCLRCD